MIASLPVVPEPLIHRCDTPGPRYTTYPPVSAWDPGFGAEAYAEALRRLRAREEAISLYVHFPFCAHRCLYCGCNAIPTARGRRLDRYLDSLEHELDLVTAALGRGRRVDTMRWGGGTPNLLDAAQTARAFRMVADRFTLLPEAACGLDADPREVSAAQLRLYHDLGFTRIRFGVQDVDPMVQRAIGRIQSTAIVRDAFRLTRDAGFTTITLDVLYGLPRQTLDTVDATVAAVLELAPERVACFAYAHVPARRPHQRAIPEEALPDAVGRMALFRRLAERLEAGGYSWVGPDHFARERDPIATAHRARRLHRNVMGFSDGPSRPVIGVGMSAISQVGDAFVQNADDLSRWTDAVAEGVLPVERGHWLTDDDRRRGEAMRAIQCTMALPHALATGDLAPALDALRAFEADGLVVCEPDQVRITALGRFFLRRLCQPFDAHQPLRGAARPD